jgi:hypothetical protein
MTSKEALKELYNERSYAYGDKVCHKGKGWNEAIKHYDNIGKCLQIIDRDLEVLEVLKKQLKFLKR